MKAIIIGAGRGARLMPHTSDVPKCFAEVKGKRILDWGLGALKAGGLKDVVFVGGYQIDKVREAYPDFAFCHNSDWESNNIMVSLMHAESHMSDGFVCAYSDILYGRDTVASLMASNHEITIVCDTAWRDRYARRSEHPEDDAEKVRVTDGRIDAINRTMRSEHAIGEYIGVARFSREGAATLQSVYVESKIKYEDGPFQASTSFQKAYLIDLFQEMIDVGVPLHAMEIEGGYIEVDTNQDFHHARETWNG